MLLPQEIKTHIHLDFLESEIEFCKYFLNDTPLLCYQINKFPIKAPKINAKMIAGRECSFMIETMQIAIAMIPKMASSAALFSQACEY